jgi:20S proteasome subunit beta 3
MTSYTTVYQVLLQIPTHCQSAFAVYLAAELMSRKEHLRFRVNMYRMKEEREITPKTFTHLVSSTLYEKRFGPFFIEPVVAGLPTPTELDPNPKPFISTMDT